jgi:hypothetical protein
VLLPSAVALYAIDGQRGITIANDAYAVVDNEVPYYYVSRRDFASNATT